MRSNVAQVLHKLLTMKKQYIEIFAEKVTGACNRGTGSGGVPVLQQARGAEGSPRAGTGLPQEPPDRPPTRRS